MGKAPDMDALMQAFAQKKRKGQQPLEMPQDKEAAMAGMLEAMRGDQAPAEDVQHTAPAFTPEEVVDNEDAHTRMLRCLDPMWWET